jgi:Ca2+-binding EF-hand superfamily protein
MSRDISEISTGKVMTIILLSSLIGALLIWAMNSLMQPQAFSPFDRNKDNALSYQEFSIAMNLLFKKLDSDKDGRVSLDEFSKAKDSVKLSLDQGITMAFRFNEIDVDNDNYISRAEFLSEQHLKPFFRIFDKDDDGFIRRGESKAGLMKYLFP